MPVALSLPLKPPKNIFVAGTLLEWQYHLCISGSLTLLSLRSLAILQFPFRQTFSHFERNQSGKHIFFKTNIHLLFYIFCFRYRFLIYCCLVAFINNIVSEIYWPDTRSVAISKRDKICSFHVFFLNICDLCPCYFNKKNNFANKTAANMRLKWPLTTWPCGEKKNSLYVSSRKLPLQGNNLHL